jgi:hypothetical protein
MRAFSPDWPGRVPVQSFVPAFNYLPVVVGRGSIEDVKVQPPLNTARHNNNITTVIILFVINASKRTLELYH